MSNAKILLSRPFAAPHRPHRPAATWIVRAEQRPLLVRTDGSSTEMAKAVMVVGTGPIADIQMQAANVAAEHARLEWKSGRLFCTALAADPDAMLSTTFTWLDQNELRPGVSYMVSPGAKLAFGEPDNAVVAEFTESGGGGAMADMLFKGMASQASIEVQSVLNDKT